MINLAELAFKQWQYEDELAIQRAIASYRKYYEGEQDSLLTDRLREFLNVKGLPSDFRMNVCRPVVGAVVERLVLEGFSVAEANQQTWADGVFKSNLLALQSSDVHENAVRDSESFVIVDWDTRNARPRLTPHQRYVSSEAEGDDEGCKVNYPNGNVSAPPLFASKRWLDTASADKPFRRLTLYWPDRVEKYFMNGDWEPFYEDFNAAGAPVWPLPWVDAQGQPLGIPVLHFKQPGLRSELSDAVFMQNAINKTLIDLLASADTSAFRILYTFGFIPTTDGQPLRADRSNLMAVKPGALIGTTRTPSEVSMGALEGADPTALVNMLGQELLWLAVVTDTPVSRFQFSGQIAAEGTLKQQTETLLTKCRKRMSLFGETWSAAMQMARRLSNVFGQAGLDESLPITATWSPLDVRSDADRQNEWKTKSDLQVPVQQLWSEMGYDQERIAAMWQMREDEALMRARVAASTAIPTMEDASDVQAV